MRLETLQVVTFSGPHGSGKTTLLGDLKKDLQGRARSKRVALTASCSTRLFERMQAGEITMPQGVDPPSDYDDIDALGLRAFFQKRLPDSLALEVEIALQRVRCSHASTTLLVDRWFPDIYAYTLMESSNTALHSEVRDLCRSRCSLLMDAFAAVADVFTITNVYVSQKSVTWTPSRSQSNKFRATCDPEKWEALCLSQWKAAVGRRRLLVVTKSGRRDRVLEILRVLDGRTRVRN